MTAGTQRVESERKQVVLVTGCADGGIGYHYCLKFKASGCEVYATDVQPLETMRSLEVQGIKILRLDVTSESSVKCVVDSIMAEAGKIDILVNNAGIGICGPLAEMAVRDVRRNFEVNVFGTLSVLQHVLPHMIKAGGGKIVNIGSVSGYVATPWNGSYNATKAALHSLTDTLRLELKPFNIDVVLITPGAIKSNLGKSNLEIIEGRKWSLYATYDADIRERANAGGAKECNACRGARRESCGDNSSQAIAVALCLRLHDWVIHRVVVSSRQPQGYVHGLAIWTEQDTFLHNCGCEQRSLALLQTDNCLSCICMDVSFEGVTSLHWCDTFYPVTLSSDLV